MDDRYCYLLEPGSSRMEYNKKLLQPDETWPCREVPLCDTDTSGSRASFKRRWTSAIRRRVQLFFFISCMIFLKLFSSCLLSGFVTEEPPWPWPNSSANLSVLLRHELQMKHYNNFVIPDHLTRHRTNERRPNVNCPALFNGDEEEISYAKEYMRSIKPEVLKDSDYINMTRDCAYFRKSRGYIMEPLSQEEVDSPIAFSILMYKNTFQSEKLLRAIYMRQNYYCIHIDAKASDIVHLAVRAIAGCFPNVFVASRLESVYWGHVSIVYAEMNCLRDLMQYQWKYFINLSGQMFPLHSNKELVRILNLYDGANDIEGTTKRNGFPMIFRHSLRWSLMKGGFMMPLPQLNDKPPHNITLYKGSNQVVMSRAFALYLLHSPVARDFLEWLGNTCAPDEYFWPSLNHNTHLHVPGAYKGDPESKTFTARATQWLALSNQKAWSWKPRKCRGKWVREICVLGVGDLSWTNHRPELFVNKLYSDYQWLTLECLDQLIYNRTMSPKSDFNLTYYKNLPFVKHKELVVDLKEAINHINRR